MALQEDTAVKLALGKFTTQAGVVIEQGSGHKTKRWTIAYSDFTDGGGATGTLVLSPALPAGSTFPRWKAHTTTGFTGGAVSAAILTVGDGSTADRFCDDAAADDLFAAGFDQFHIGMAYANTHVNPYINTETSITLTITTAGANFSALTAGAMTFDVDLDFLEE